MALLPRSRMVVDQVTGRGTLGSAAGASRGREDRARAGDEYRLSPGLVDVPPGRVRDWRPKTLLGLALVRARHHIPADQWAEILDRLQSTVVAESQLHALVRRGWGRYLAGEIPFAAVRLEDHGIVSRKVVTDTGVGYIVDAFQNLVELETMKYHGLGTGTGNEAASDSALGTELTTEYTGNVRATGTTAESAANAFQTVATNTLDSGTPAITEHGVFSASSAGVLIDRSKFSAINLVGANGDALTTTYTLTFTSGG